MGRQIIRQSDGLYALFSTEADSFVDGNLTRAALLAAVCGEAVERAAADAIRVMDALDAGGKPYHQFTLSWDQALARHAGADGSPPAPSPSEDPSP